MLFRNADQTAVVTGVKGLAWVLEHRESKSLNLDLRVAASATLACLKERQPRGYYYGARSLFDGTAKTIAELAIEWKDSVLWSGVLNLDHLTGGEKQESLKEGLKLFDLDLIRPA